MKQKLFPNHIYERQADICSALANPVRLMILEIVGEGECTASDLQEKLAIPKSNLSQHLAVLKRAGILSARAEGRFQFLNLALPEVKQACALVRKVLASQMNQQAILAKAIKLK